MESYTDEIFNQTLSIISDLIPQTAPIIHTLQFPGTISDAVFAYKLKRLLDKQNPDLMEWLKISWKFESCQKDYAENVRKLIYLLISMNEDKLIDVYSNLLHAHQLTLLNTAEFFRLGWILTQIYSDDLFLLKEFKPKVNDSENQRLKILEPYGLLNKQYINSYNSKSVIRYSLTNIGKKMVACGIDFENYYEYK